MNTPATTLADSSLLEAARAGGAGFPADTSGSRYGVLSGGKRSLLDGSGAVRGL